MARQYYAKATWNQKQINAVKELCSGIEIQLMDPAEDSFFTSPKWLHEVNEEDYHYIKAFHMPIYFKVESENNLFSLGDEAYFSVLWDVAKRVNFLNLYIGEPVRIIIHTNVTKEDRVKWHYCIDALKEIAEEYENELIFCIENNSYNYFEALNIVKEVSQKNVVFCLDTCHLMIQRQNDIVFDLLENEAFPRKILNVSKKYIGWVHLCSAEESNKGFGKGTGHGAAFSSNNSRVWLGNLLLYLPPNISPVLEINEKNYTNRQNLKQALQICKKYDI